MFFNDLRDLILDLENQERLFRVKAEVDPKYELGAICYKLLKESDKAVIFERIKGSNMPVLTNVFTTIERVGMILDTSRDVASEWVTRMNKTWPEPIISSNGPCKEIIREHGDFDLKRDLPQIWWNVKDGGPYITLGAVFTKDPETKSRNTGIYRMMIHGRDEIGILFSPYGDTGVNFEKAAKRKKPLEVAVCIGLDPVIVLAAATPLMHDEDELALAGALRGKALDLVRCESVGLEVPACSEIVLEGEILLDKKLPEGPFGDWLGYYSDVETGMYGETRKVPRHVIRVKTLTRRQDSIYQGVYCGPALNEDSVIEEISREALTLRDARMLVPQIKDIHISASSGAYFVAYVSVKKEDAETSERAMNAVWSTRIGSHIKILIVVDDEINVRNKTEVEWAVATRFQPRKVMIIPNSSGSLFDPSQEIPGVTSKMGIDATKPQRFPEVAKPDQRLIERIEARWHELFPKLSN